MNLKKIKTINIFLLLILSIISHNIYKYFPNILTAIFFPINESIFEHMKIIFTTILLTGISDYVIFKLTKIKYNNFKFQLFFSAFISISIFLIIYLPIHYLLEESLPLTIIILFMTYIFSQIISYFILTHKKLTLLNQIAIPLIILVYFNFLTLTFIPNKNDFFYDTYTTKETWIKIKFLFNS